MSRGRLTMGVGLQPLEFTECLADSPHFRDNLQRHEKELERTSQQIKRLIKEVKDVVQAAKRKCRLSQAARARARSCYYSCVTKATLLHNVASATMSTAGSAAVLR